MSAALGEEEPLVSHTVESDIKVLKKDSLIMSKVSRVNALHVDMPVILLKVLIKCKAESVSVK